MVQYLLASFLNEKASGWTPLSSTKECNRLRERGAYRQSAGVS